MGDYKYYAFISYSHKDKAAAKKLYRRLEYYRLPTALMEEHRKKYGKDLPKKLTPVFIDDAEMANLSVQEGMRSGLDRSRFLVVVCSPNSARSPYVNDEVSHFLASGGSDRIIPYIVSGKPCTGDPETECYPPAMRDADRLGADVQELRGDAILRVISVMLGVDMGVLAQREKQRTMVRAALIGALLLTIVGILTFSNVKVTQAYQQVSLSEQKVHSSLMNSYANTGAERYMNGDAQEALAYYARVLSERPDNRIAKVGALAALQDMCWLYHDDQMAPQDIPETPKAVSFTVERVENEAALHVEDGRELRFVLPVEICGYLDDGTLFWNDIANRIYLMDYESDSRIVLIAGDYVFFYHETGFQILFSAAGYRFFTQTAVLDLSAEYLAALGADIRQSVFSSLSIKALFEQEEHPSMASDLPCSISFVPGHKYLEVGYDMMMFVLDVEQGKVVSHVTAEKIENIWEAKELTLSPDENQFAYVFGTTTDLNSNFRTALGFMQSGSVCFSEEFSNISYVSLSYSPDSRGLLWAQKQQLSLLDPLRGSTKAVLPLPNPITDTTFTTPGTILTKSEDNSQQLYRIVRFTANEIEPAVEASDTEHLRITEEKTGCYLELVDRNGIVSARCALPSSLRVNEYLMDPRYDETTRTAYAYDSERLLIFAVSYNKREMIKLGEIIMNEGDFIFGCTVFPGGVALQIKEDYFILYRAGETQPYRTVRPKLDEEFINFYEGVTFPLPDIMTFVCYKGEDLYTCVWDLADNRCIAKVLMDAGEDPSLVLNIPDPDEAAVAALQALCCYTFNDDGTLALKEPTFDGNLGNWSKYLTAVYPYEAPLDRNGD